jgi:hypothetical protein
MVIRENRFLEGKQPLLTPKFNSTLPPSVSTTKPNFKIPFSQNAEKQICQAPILNKVPHRIRKCTKNNPIFKNALKTADGSRRLHSNLAVVFSLSSEF